MNLNPWMIFNSGYITLDIFAFDWYNNAEVQNDGISKRL